MLLSSVTIVTLVCYCYRFLVPFALLLQGSTGRTDAGRAVQAVDRGCAAAAVLARPGTEPWDAVGGEGVVAAVGAHGGDRGAARQGAGGAFYVVDERSSETSAR